MPQLKLLLLSKMSLNMNMLFATTEQVHITKFCIVFPWQCFTLAWTHGIKSHSLVAKQQQSILCMILYVALSQSSPVHRESE